MFHPSFLCYTQDCSENATGMNFIVGSYWYFNPLMPNDLYKRRTLQVTSRRHILYIYSTNISTEYFKHAA